MNLFLNFAAICLAASSVSASVFLPYSAKQSANTRSKLTKSYTNNVSSFDREVRRMRRSCSTNAAVAMAIPGYGLAEQVNIY
jgi:hypothetical protein